MTLKKITQQRDREDDSKQMRYTTILLDIVTSKKRTMLYSLKTL